MIIKLPLELAQVVRDNRSAQLVVFVNGQYMPPGLSYQYTVNDQEICIEFRELGETIRKLTEVLKGLPDMQMQVNTLKESTLLQVSIVQCGATQWHYKNNAWIKYSGMPLLHSLS